MAMNTALNPNMRRTSQLETLPNFRTLATSMKKKKEDNSNRDLDFGS
jgi:hypothetical protein